MIAATNQKRSKMIRKCIISLAMLTVCQAAFAQGGADRLFDEFSQNPDVVTLSVGEISISSARLSPKTIGVDSFELLFCDKCEQSVKNRLADAVINMEDEYESVSLSNESGGKRVRTFTKVNDDMIREIVIAATGDKAPALLMRVKGKLTSEIVEAIQRRLIDKQDK